MKNRTRIVSTIGIIMLLTCFLLLAFFIQDTVHLREVWRSSREVRNVAIHQISTGMSLGEVEKLPFEYTTREECDIGSQTLVLYGFGLLDKDMSTSPYYLLLYFEGLSDNAPLVRIVLYDIDLVWSQPCWEEK
jgi:hypothetical protein